MWNSWRRVDLDNPASTRSSTTFQTRHTARLKKAYWAAGLLAARYIAVQQGTPPPTPRGWRDRLESIAASSHLEHGDGANQIFVDLLAHTRTHPGTRLARW
jgi:hypothetical protein